MRGRRVIPFLVVIALALFSGVSWGQEACQLGEWSAPRVVWRAFNDSATMHPRAMVGSKDQLVIVSEYPAQGDSQPAQHRPATALGLLVDRRSGKVTELAKPIANMSYRGLRVGLDRDGAVHLLWSEIAGVSVRDNTGGAGATQVWAARVEGGRVTIPALVVADSAVEWDIDPDAGIQLDASGQLHTVVVSTPALTSTPFAHLMYDGTRWRVDHLFTRPSVIPLAASFDITRDTIRAVFAAIRAGGDEPFRPSLWFTQRALDAARWSEPLRLSGDSESFFRMPRLSVTPRGTIRIAWLQSDAGGAISYDAMGLVESTDGGRSFSAQRTFRQLRDMQTLPSIWSDDCSITHVHVTAGATDGEGDVSRTIAWDGAVFALSDPQPHPFLYLGHSVMSARQPGPLTRIWSSVFVAPTLPIMLIWYESHQRAVVPIR